MQPIAIGDLLLAVQPLAFLSGPPGQEEIPDWAQLVPQLRAITAGGGSGSGGGSGGFPVPHAAQWIHALYKGPGAAASASSKGVAVAARTEEAASINALLHGRTEALPGASAASSPPPPVEDEDLSELVALNAFGEKYDDHVATAFLAAEAAPGSGATAAAPPQFAPYVGIWPHFSLFNHSCLPNAVHYTIGR